MRGIPSRQANLSSNYVPDDPRNILADLKRYFYGANVDVGPLGQAWSGIAYEINQMVNDVVNRHVIAAERILYMAEVLHVVTKEWQLGGDVRLNRISGTGQSNCVVILPGTSTVFLNPNATTDAPCTLQALPGTGNIWTYTAQAIGANVPFESTTFNAKAGYITSPAYCGQSLLAR